MWRQAHTPCVASGTDTPPQGDETEAMSDDNTTTPPPEETEEDAAGHIGLRKSFSDAGTDDDTEGNRLKSKPSE